jgi:hypothetical protein
VRGHRKQECDKYGGIENAYENLCKFERHAGGGVKTRQRYDNLHYGFWANKPHLKDVRYQELVDIRNVYTAWLVVQMAGVHGQTDRASEPLRLRVCELEARERALKSRDRGRYGDREMLGPAESGALYSHRGRARTDEDKETIPEAGGGDSVETISTYYKDSFVSPLNESEEIGRTNVVARQCPTCPA